MGGVTNYIVPKLNDYYSGLVPEKMWERTCFAKIANDRDVYVLLVKRFMKYQKEHYDPRNKYKPSQVFRSFHKKIWDATKNEELYLEIDPNWEPPYSTEFWAHDGGDECLIGGVYIEEYCSKCKNPVCLLDRDDEE